jgi:hypothetical protein
MSKYCFIFVMNLKTTRIMKSLLKSLIAIAILFLTILAVTNTPKGNDYIEWEKNMVESGQINIK